MSCYKYSIVLALLFLLITQGVSNAQNIISNSGFEAGKPGGLPDDWGDQKERNAEGRVVLTDKEAQNGKQCLLIEHTNEEGYIHPNKSVEIKRGDYTFRLWAKSDKDIQFSAQIYRATDWSAPLSESCSLKSGEWTKFEFPVSFLEAIPGSIQIGLTVPGRLWLDDVELVAMELAKEPARIQLWDTVSPFVSMEEKTDWKPLSAGIQPQGDVVLGNGHLAVVFGSETGVVIYSESGEKRAEIIPLESKGEHGGIAACKILHNTDDEATIEVSPYAVFSFSRERIIQIKPIGKGVSVLCPIRFAIVPNFISDDLLFDPRNYPLEALHIPSENFLLSLLEGENSALVMTWQDGKQRVSLSVKGERLFRAIDFENDGKSLYLAVLDAPGIWHEELLKRSNLEKDVVIDWKRPFPAKWVTQLREAGVNTRYTFRESRGKRFWRAGVGHYPYPVWFQDENTFYRLGKKIPPEGESIIYFMERKGSPASVSAPADILRQTLGDETYERLTDPDGRLTRSLRRPDSVIGSATCGVTAKLKRVFEAGEEVEKKDYVKGGTEDMIYFLFRERERALEYQDFAHEMIEFLASAKKEKPELTQFLDEMESIAGELIAAFEHEKENIKDLDYARQLAKETRALTQKKSPDNLNAFLELKGKWIGMGGAVDDLNRKLHTITRKLFQQAGYNCVERRETVEMAEKIRKKTIRCLRKPGYYEIWSNY